jgi:subtilase family serine protease
MKRHVLVRVVALCALTAIATFAAVTASRGHAQTAIGVRPLTTGAINAKGLAFPPDTAYCQANLGISCYSPTQFAAAYGLNALHAKGIDGRGKTIAIVDAFGSPTIANDLAVFDANYGIPAPPSLQVIQPAGSVPPFDPTNGDMVSWATETTLDVEMAHAFAPGANILLVETPVAETEGVTGFPEIVAAENYVINHRLADVISQSFGATEQTFPSTQSLLDLRSAFVNARNHNVTVLGSSGDTGATNYESDLANLYPFAVDSWPSSDPLVTSVGGTQLHLDAIGNRLAPDSVWNDGYGASGGGISTVFSRPSYQSGVKRITGSMRGSPDVSMSAAVDGAAILYYSFQPSRIGWHLVGGTSEASPQFSGIVAMADQYARQDLGLINPALYHLGYSRGGLVDVVGGDNSFGGVTGYPVTTGYDLATGLGTIDASKFVPALANAASEQGDQ